jgi:hypothetical protein
MQGAVSKGYVLMVSLGVVLAGTSCELDNPFHNSSSGRRATPEEEAPGTVQASPGSADKGKTCLDEIPRNKLVSVGGHASTITIILTIGLPADPFYKVTSTETSIADLDYEDGSNYQSERERIDEITIENSVTNITFDLQQEEQLSFPNGVMISAQLLESHSTGGGSNRVFTAAVECGLDMADSISERMWNRIKTRLGIQ